MARVSVALRRRVSARARSCCEYCRIRCADTVLGCEVDHAIALKHRGRTTARNLVLACFLCNRFKGPNVGGIDPQTGQFVRLFNPRSDRWAEHFSLRGGRISPRTSVGRVTVGVLVLNQPQRVAQRDVLSSFGAYPG